MDILGFPYTNSWMGNSMMKSSNDSLAYTNRPGNYWAVMSLQGRYYSEADQNDHFFGFNNNQNIPFCFHFPKLGVSPNSLPKLSISVALKDSRRISMTFILYVFRIVIPDLLRDPYTYFSPKPPCLRLRSGITVPPLPGERDRVRAKYETTALDSFHLFLLK